MSDEHVWLSVVQKAEQLGISADTIRRWVREGRVPHWRTSSTGPIRIALKWHPEVGYHRRQGL